MNIDGYDIALLRLDQPVAGVAPLEMMAVPELDALSEGSELRVIGWGKQSTIASNYPDHLMQVDIPLVSNETCNADESYFGARRVRSIHGR